MFSFKKSPPKRGGSNKKLERKRVKVAATAGHGEPVPGPTLAEEMARYGIMRIPVDYFHYAGFRYTNLKDALAQARMTDRDAIPSSTTGQ